MTIWKEYAAPLGEPLVYDVSEEMGEGGGAVLIAARPDWVRRPDTGEQVRVLDLVRVPTGLTCPLCGGPLSRAMLKLEGGIGVAQCAKDGFLFMKGAWS